MLNNEDDNTLLDYLRKDVNEAEARLEIALAILKNAEDVKKETIKHISRKLAKALKVRAEQLGNSWQVVNDLEKDPFGEYSQIYMTKKDWGDLLWISFGSCSGKIDAKKFVLGVSNTKNEEHKQALGKEQIVAALKEQCPEGESSDSWPFFIKKYEDLTKLETLFSFLGVEGENQVLGIAETMCSFAQASEHIIDEVVKDFLEQRPSLSETVKG